MQILESQTMVPRFTGDQIPPELIKDIGKPFDMAVNGFDHSDKGFVVSFDKRLSPRTIDGLAKRLNTEAYDWNYEGEARDQDVVFHVYHIRTDQ